MILPLATMGARPGRQFYLKIAEKLLQVSAWLSMLRATPQKQPIPALFRGVERRTTER
jgi:hypothetical protein